MLRLTAVFVAMTVLFSAGVTFVEGAPAAGAKVDLNLATVDQLDELPGIGPAIAQRIIDYREEKGPFKRIEDLMNVKGIGEKKFLQLKELVAVEAPPVPEPKKP